MHNAHNMNDNQPTNSQQTQPTASPSDDPPSAAAESQTKAGARGPLSWISANWQMLIGILGICGAISSFVYKDIFMPAASPVNIDVKLGMILDPQIKDDKLVSDPRQQAIPVKLTIAVSNKSTHKTLLLKDPFWIAYGYQIMPKEGARNYIDINHRFNEKFAYNSPPRNNALRLGQYKLLRDIVAAGRVFGADKIRPDETFSEERIIPVPPDSYDFIQVRMIVPTVKESGYGRALQTEVQLDERNELQFFWCNASSQTNGNPTIAKTCLPLPPEAAKRHEAQAPFSIGEIWLDNDLASRKTIQQ